jgi:hypothetical protein
MVAPPSRLMREGVDGQIPVGRSAPLVALVWQ